MTSRKHNKSLVCDVAVKRAAEDVPQLNRYFLASSIVSSE